MTPTERARRSDALYYGDISRRELSDRIAFLESTCIEMAEYLSQDWVQKRLAELRLETHGGRARDKRNE